MQKSEFDCGLERAKVFYRRTEGDLVTGQIPLCARFHREEMPVSFASRTRGEYVGIAEGETWGGPWEYAWFHITGAIPSGWQDKEVVLVLNFNGEALIFDSAGSPAYGLSAGSIFHENYTKEIYPLPPDRKTAGKIDCWAEAVAANLFGLKMDTDPAEDCPEPRGRYCGTLNRCRMGVFNRELWHLRLDLEVLLNLIEALPEQDYRSANLVAAMNRAIDRLAGGYGRIADARRELRRVLDLPAWGSAPTVTAVGHAHIDTAWLWPVRESLRKCARTFASQVDLLKKYPAYVFGASQALYYQMMKDHYPDLYIKIKEYVRRGRWEILGGMWVEADCNLTGGESLVRQLVYGKNFFRDEFGTEVKTVWLPDAFGYSASLPQIFRKAGCACFLTTKLAWNKENEFPFSTFRWIGIDGSEILSHLPPEGTYNARNLPAKLIAAQNRMNESHLVPEFLSLFGIGDGGGGPKAEYIERGLRLENLEGVPRVKFGRSLDFFDRVAKNAAALPAWNGELYLELHRGTYTTQARVKRWNRRLEQRLAAMEFLGSCLPPGQYPQAELEFIWKGVLLNQFHDILPGSSIGEVYKTAEKEYAGLWNRGDRLIRRMLHPHAIDRGSAVTVVNSLSCESRPFLELPSDWRNRQVLDSEGNALDVQGEDGTNWIRPTLPPSSITVLHRGSIGEPVPIREDGLPELENDLVRYEFDRNGRLTAAFDKSRRRRILADGAAGNVLSLYHDHPNHWEAWDIDRSYEQEFLENPVAAAVKRQCGILRQSLSFSLKIGNSRIVQRISLDAGSRLLTFATSVDWQESRRMLRVSFPTAIFAGEAAFDIQYGFVRRSTHGNTGWDRARFEVCAQRYADLSEADYGVALLNDCKYGHRVSGGVIDLCLLRSPRYPDWDADRGKHEFSYGLYPHPGSFADSDVIAAAACFNRPPIVVKGDCSALRVPCRLASDGISLEVVKKAEKEDCTVVRLVETKGKHSSGTLHFPAERTVVSTDLLEWSNLSEEDSRDGKLDVELNPFEIRTLKLLPADAAAAGR